MHKNPFYTAMRVTIIAWSTTSWSVDIKAQTPAPIPETVAYKTGDTILKAYIYRPEGEGPFPAIVWQHGSPKPLMESGPVSRFDALAALCVSNGYVLFIPDRIHRNIYFRTLADRISGSVASPEKEFVFRHALEQLEENHQVSIDALEWLKGQGYVDENRIVMSGYSMGSVQTLYEAKKHLGVRAYIPFTLPSSTWGGSEQLQDLMVESVKAADAPILLIQAQNDYNLRASEARGKDFAQKGPPNGLKIYPPYGKTQKDANLFVLTGCEVWGQDVFTFIQAAVQP
ncbi:MAG: dienelactone hydrolase [Verrucomicrobiales bacterium]|nr:dienelactone hydrolase [Verrucomicrobiales bacterium]